MNQRERLLAILVGGLFVIGIGQWGFTKYKTAIKQRRSQYESLQERQVLLAEKRNQGAWADRQMGEYLVRSVSSDVERARSDYQSWLFGVIENHNIKDAKVDSGRTVPIGDLYQQMTFLLTGRAEAPEIIDFMHEIPSII